MEAVFKTPELDDFLLPPVLGDQITDSTLMHRHLPRQADVDKIMEQINRKYLTKLQLPCSIRDMQAAYLNSPHFRDIYLAVGMNKMPSKARTAKKMESDLMNAVYMIHGRLLYRYMRDSTGESEPVLFEYKPGVPITGTHAETREKLQGRLSYFRRRLEDFRSNRMVVMNKDRQPHGFTVGQIVYMYNPSGGQLQTGSRKIQCHFVGPLAIYKCISPNQFLLMSLDGVLYPMVVEEARLKPGLIATHKGPARNMNELKNAAKLAYATHPQLQCIKT